MQFIGTQQPAKGDSLGYFYSCASIGKDAVLLWIMGPWIAAIASACGSKWDAAKVVKSWDFGHRNTRQNTRAKVTDPSQARKDRIMEYALKGAVKADTPEKHAATVQLMAAISKSDDEVLKVHTDLFGVAEPDVAFTRTIGPTPEEIITHLRECADALESQIEEKKAG